MVSICNCFAHLGSICKRRKPIRPHLFQLHSAHNVPSILLLPSWICPVYLVNQVKYNEFAYFCTCLSVVIQIFLEAIPFITILIIIVASFTSAFYCLNLGESWWEVLLIKFPLFDYPCMIFFVVETFFITWTLGIVGDDMPDENLLNVDVVIWLTLHAAEI